MAQKFKFPMEYLRVTQGQLDAYSHAGSLAMDFGGRDGGADRLYAPCDIVVKRCRQNANGELYLESCEKVLFADGTTDYARLLCMHDGTFNVQQGQVIKQGEYFYDEGGMGAGRKNKFANHVHMEAGKGKWKSTTQSKNSYGTYVIENQASLYDLFILGDDVQLLSTGGYSWKKESEFEREEENCHSERLCREESQNCESGTLSKSETQPDSVCDTSQPTPAQYDSALVCTCPCHSERREESHAHKSRCCTCNRCPCHSEAQSGEESHNRESGTLSKSETQPDSICDTSQSAPAQYDSTLACGCLCHSERLCREESPAHPAGTLPCTCPHTAQLYTENQSLKAIIEKIKQTVNGVNI